MIGVFDSGLGGLTVLQALTQALPQQPFIYLGDNANAPYGHRSRPEIYELTRAAVKTLFDKGCRLVVLACNTAAAIALRKLQQEWLPRFYPDHRVLGVLVPMVESLTGRGWNQDLPPSADDHLPRLTALFATQRTVESGAFSEEVAKRVPGHKVVPIACAGLVHAIEDNAPDQELDRLVAGYVARMREMTAGQVPERVVLGCTHYPLVQSTFARHLGSGPTILSQPSAVASSLADYLDRHPRFLNLAKEEPNLTCLTTGDPSPVSVAASRLFGRSIQFTSL